MVTYITYQKRLKYAVVYCDMEQIEHMMQKVEQNFLL